MNQRPRLDSPRVGLFCKKQVGCNVRPQSVDVVYVTDLGLVGQLKGVMGRKRGLVMQFDPIGL